MKPDLSEPGQLTTNQQFHYSELVTDFIPVISNEIEPEKLVSVFFCLVFT